MIESPANPRVVQAVKLHRSRYRRTVGQTLLEGRTVVEAAIAAGAPCEPVFVVDESSDVAQAAREAGLEVLGISNRVLKRLSLTETPQGPLATMPIPFDAELASRDSIYLDQVADPGNVGTIIRTAAAFDMHVSLSPRCADAWSPKCIRAAAGAHFGVSITTDVTVEDLRGVGLEMWALVPRGGESMKPATTDGPVALCVGSETFGLSTKLLQACKLRVSLEMPGNVESLNVAIAAGVAMYLRSQQ